MNNLDDYLSKKAQQLDLGREAELIKIQQLLDEKYPGKARAKKIQNNILYIQTTSSSVANELRFNQQRYLLDGITKMVIRPQ